jgi:hypothetical protein
MEIWKIVLMIIFGLCALNLVGFGLYLVVRKTTFEEGRAITPREKLLGIGLIIAGLALGWATFLLMP